MQKIFQKCLSMLLAWEYILVQEFSLHCYFYLYYAWSEEQMVMWIFRNSEHLGNPPPSPSPATLITCFRSHCDCGSYLKDTGRHAAVLVYTRNGSFTARHLEFRSAVSSILLK